MHALVEEFRLETFPTFHEGKKVLDVRGKLSSYMGSIPSMPPYQSAAVAVDPIGPRVKDASNATITPTHSFRGMPSP